jgi:hypothetical protein
MSHSLSSGYRIIKMDCEHVSKFSEYNSSFTNCLTEVN